MSKDRILLGGAPEGYDSRLLSRELERGRPVIHIARDDKRMEAMRTALAVLDPGAVVLDFPAWDCLPYDRASPALSISARRLAALHRLLVVGQVLHHEIAESRAGERGLARAVAAGAEAGRVRHARNPYSSPLQGQQQGPALQSLKGQGEAPGFGP